MAESAGCPAPKYWRTRTLEDVERILNDIELPAIIKPIHSHIFVSHYNKKLFKVNDIDELLARAKDVLKKGLKFMICEFIPGPDDLLCSYYTYNDESGNPLFHFTKRIIRRYPLNFGGGCYHITEWNPETAAMGEAFFKSIGLRGLGNIEFKRDLRDNKLKVIECNARFTAAQELLYRSGMDIALFIYNRLTGNPLPKLNGYNKSLRLWYPSKDYRAYRELRKDGNITFVKWVKSILHRQVLPCFDVRDPVPWVVSCLDTARRKVRKILSTA